MKEDLLRELIKFFRILNYLIPVYFVVKVIVLVLSSIFCI